MGNSFTISPKTSLGVIGFGAFGQLLARHLGRYFHLHVHDPAIASTDIDHVTLTDLACAARQPIVILAVPVSQMEAVARGIAPHVAPGALILDVGSVKIAPARIMANLLPPHVDIVATHPLFGPQSARAGIAGHKIALCLVRGRQGRRVAAFLRHSLKLRVLMMTPEDHDREAAIVQGLTHLIAKTIDRMGPLPQSMTTRSFELLMAAVDLVRHDSPEVFDAITRANPFVTDVRRRFFDHAMALDTQLDKGGGSCVISLETGDTPSSCSRGLLLSAVAPQ